MFELALERLRRWELENLPGADTQQGTEVLIWLLCQEKPRPLKHLYGSSRYSEPTLRACIRSFEDEGFVVLESSETDLRTRYARATSGLKERARAYQDRFKEVAALAKRNGIDVSMYGSQTDISQLANLDGAKPASPSQC